MGELYGGESLFLVFGFGFGFPPLFFLDSV